MIASAEHPMSPNLQELKDAASGLPPRERADLAQFLLRSLDEEDEQAVRAEWLALAEQRMADVRAGKVVGVPADQVLKSLLDPRR
jgi:putative addiction module component (TIGR02574 family)